MFFGFGTATSLREGKLNVNELFTVLKLTLSYIPPVAEVMDKYQQSQKFPCANWLGI